MCETQALAFGNIFQTWRDWSRTLCRFSSSQSINDANFVDEEVPHPPVGPDSLSSRVVFTVFQLDSNILLRQIAVGVEVADGDDSHP